MRARGRVRVTLADARDAETVARALAPENAGWIAQSVDGATLTAEADADGTRPLLRTLDDYLANLAAAEKAAGAARRRDGAP